MKGTLERPAVPPYLACAVAILAVSTASIFIRFAQAHMPSLVIAAWRLGIATLVLLPVAWISCRKELRALSRRELLLGLGSGVFLGLHFATWITSLELTDVATSVVLVSTTPLWVALASPLVLRERLRLPLFLGVLLVVVGGAVVAFVRPETGPAMEPEVVSSKTRLEGAGLALAGAWMGAGYFLIGRRLRRRLSLPAYTFLTYGTAALVLVILVSLTPHSLFNHPPPGYFWCVLLALVPQLLGHSTFNWALRYLPASMVALLVVGEPVGTIALAWIVLAEVPGGIKLLGCAVILLGILVAGRSEIRVAAPKGSSSG